MSYKPSYNKDPQDLNNRHSSKLGGKGVLVHFDETPITRRHGNTRRHFPSNTVWVVGGVDIYAKKCFLKFLPSRSSQDLYYFLNKYVLPGSIVHCCKKIFIKIFSEKNKIKIK